LSSPHLEASPATTFRACSSPAPTRVKPHPAPTIFSQELVHTTLSITHHTRKRPSTSPRTTHGPHYFRPWFLEPETKKLVIPFLCISLLASLSIRSLCIPTSEISQTSPNIHP
jgi:hypothetical protein